ncbi:MMPL family transporter [Mycobacterium attenuatum]|uniref:MMPL family transporter n=1 Tax=Mycobacterium attenuatum TaxID=2341086 RepID=UPI00145A01DA|nr:MMPL family transporter [Mycobacterium attenuatum]
MAVNSQVPTPPRLLTWIRIAAITVAALAGLLMFAGLENKLSVGGFIDPDAPSTRATHTLTQNFGVGAPNLILIASTRHGHLDQADANAVEDFAHTLRAQPGVVSVQTYFGDHSPALMSADQTTTAILARLSGSEDDVRASIVRLQPLLTEVAHSTNLDVQVTGQAEILRAVSKQATTDVVRAEMIAVPITFVLLLVWFGGLYAALIPVLVGVLGMLISVLAIGLINMVTPISVYTLNLITGLALGLAIDYSLLIITRYREGVRAGQQWDLALSAAVTRCRRTILISAATVALCLVGLIAIPLVYLRSLAIAGIAGIAAVCLVTLWVLPVLLHVLGNRIDQMAVRKVNLSETGPVLTTILRFVIRFRLAAAIGASVALLILLAPVAGLRLGPVDDRVLPENAPARLASDAVRRDLPALGADPIFVYAQAAGGPVEDFAKKLSEIATVLQVRTGAADYMNGHITGPGVARFQNRDSCAIQVIPQPGATIVEQQNLTRQIRDYAAPFGTEVAGLYSEDIDTQAAITRRLPMVLAIVAIAMLPLIFVLTGGVLVSIKALLLTLLSLTASFGAMVFVFQEGHLSTALRFTATGTISATSPILMFCLAFGLSMDYQIFLLARIREEYDRTGSNSDAVVIGLTTTAKMISVAALLIATVFLAIGTSGISFIKLLGLGLSIAVLIDAFLVRLFLVPSLMLILDKANWWAPKFLRHKVIAG